MLIISDLKIWVVFKIMSKSGLSIPEAVGFGVLGATIGFVACSVLGHEAAAHTGIGMTLGAVLMIAMGRLPGQRQRHALPASRRPGEPVNPAASR
jgi:hypothetical protein